MRSASPSYRSTRIRQTSWTRAAIDAGAWHVGDAYYWRAWNRLQMGQAQLAYDDATTAKRPGVLVVHEWMGLNDYAKRVVVQAELQESRV